MPRRPRKSILYDGCYAHVFSRSLEKRFIFPGREEFEFFSKLLLKAKQRYDFQIFHYCLLHTHFHLAVGITDLKAFSEALKVMKWKYTQDFNCQRKRRGTVWQERFKSLVIEDGKYMRACGSYIENNPVEAGIVKKAVDWSYSSSRHYELGKADPLVDEYLWDGAEVEISGDEKAFFEAGQGIGSEKFLFYLNEDLSSGMPVP